MDMERIVIIDDEEDICFLLAKFIASIGYQASWTTDASETESLIRKVSPSAVILDLRLGRHDGLEILREICKQHPHLPVIILTANGEVHTAVQAMKDGAYYYLVKPWDGHELKILLKKAIEDAGLRRRYEEMRNRLDESERLLREFVAAAETALAQTEGKIQLSEISRAATGFLEKKLILDALVKSNWHRGNASQLLGIDPKTLYNKMREYALPGI